MENVGVPENGDVRHLYNDNKSHQVTITGVDLTFFMCWARLLTALDVNENHALQELHCNMNEITHFDISKNSYLYWLNGSENAINQLDVSHNPQLERLSARCNISNIDVSKNKRLMELYCWGNKLTSIDRITKSSPSPFKCYK